MQSLYILITALLIDIICGEAPNRFHPVAWLGHLISFETRYRPRQGNKRQIIYGLFIVLLTVSFITSVIYLGMQALKEINILVYILASAYLLKNTFSLRGLWQAVERVKKALSADDIQNARKKAQALVSRDVNKLDRPQLISAAIESCAENLCDSFVAPLLYYAVFGLPGAVCYRIVNTYDAMIGYRGKWEYTGKTAARWDDVFNYIPARISGFIIVIASALCKANAANGWRTMLAQHGMTASPNAGWSMSAMAGALNIPLEKEGEYRLGTGTAVAEVAAISRSQAVMLTAAACWAVLLISKEVIVYAAA